MKNIIDNLIFGRNPVKEALKAQKVKTVFIQDSFSDRTILDLIKLQKVDIKRVSLNELNNKTNGVHQGIMAEIKPYEYLDLNELIRRSKDKKVPIIVLLDGINDPQNMGAILRSCDVFDVTGIIISKHNQVPLNSTVAKTSAGAINYVPVSLVNNMNQAIDKLKENGFWVVSSDGSAKQSYTELKYDFPIALVIGSEGQGVSQLVLKNSDYIIKIPQNGHVNSLNASVAAGILLSRIRG
ncbi:MAG: 23S rRNA (guanosine(2251)-2'-O)-methyltransferase RlmB [Bacilli bacterium]|nr:23S rRNA (guanosine(2251)-2'-O)-methyltransferase RlmB [Bacilli bacterium]